MSSPKEHFQMKRQLLLFQAGLELEQLLKKPKSMYVRLELGLYHPIETGVINSIDLALLRFSKNQLGCPFMLLRLNHFLKELQKYIVDYNCKLKCTLHFQSVYQFNKTIKHMQRKKQERKERIQCRLHYMKHMFEIMLIELKYVACVILLYTNDVLIPSPRMHTHNFTFDLVGNNASE